MQSPSTPLHEDPDLCPILQPSHLFYDEVAERVSNLIDDDLKVRLFLFWIYSVYLHTYPRQSVFDGRKRKGNKSKVLKMPSSSLPSCSFI